MNHHLKAKQHQRIEDLCKLENQATDDLGSAQFAAIESLCKPDQMLSTQASTGVQFLEAWFAGEAYENHRHDSYAIGITDSGVQCYDYRGATQSSTPGSMMVLHPDEMHNGRAGSSEGFGYRMLYVEPVLIADAVRHITGRYCPLPFVKDSIFDNPYLKQAVLLAADGSLANHESLGTCE